MEAMSSQLARIWVSERLIFKAMEDNEESKDILHRAMIEPTSYGLSMPVIQRPVTKASTDKILSEMISKAEMAVIICLPSEESAREPGKPIGYLHMSRRFEANAMIGLGFLEDYQNKGYGRETINWALDWAFRYGRLHRVAIGTVSFNERAMHLYQSIGFIQEARIREVVYMNLAWHDLIDYSMLESEWRKLREIE